MRYFLAQLAKAIRKGEISVLCFSLLPNHCHMIVRSLRGVLSRSMGRVFNAYVRRFNRTRGRDGSLFRGRFLSKPVTTETYLRTVVRYIDDNAVDAGLVAHARDYPWSSAFHYARGSGPVWLDREWIESEVMRKANSETYQPADYGLCFPSRLPPELRQWVERRLTAGYATVDDLDDLVAAAPDEVLQWMQRRAHMADGTEPGLVLVPPQLVDAALAEADLRRTMSLQTSPRRSPGAVARAGLIRDLCGVSLRELAAYLRIPQSTAQLRSASHVTALRQEPAYARWCSQVVGIALARMRAATRPSASDGGRKGESDAPAR